MYRTKVVYTVYTVQFVVTVHCKCNPVVVGHTNNHLYIYTFYFLIPSLSPFSPPTPPLSLFSSSPLPPSLSFLSPSILLPPTSHCTGRYYLIRNGNILSHNLTLTDIGMREGISFQWESSSAGVSTLKECTMYVYTLVISVYIIIDSHNYMCVYTCTCVYTYTSIHICIYIFSRELLR